MRNSEPTELVISGLGVTSAIGQTKEAFIRALLLGNHSFGYMKRPGRQKGSSFIGAEISSFITSERLSNRLLRASSVSGHAALVTLDEAWRDARLDEVDPNRIGLVIGGSNIQQREIVRMVEEYSERAEYVRPTHGFSFMDTDLCGLCTEQFGIRGISYTVGGASASGQVAIIEAIKTVLTGQVEVCIALGALMDLSYLEFHALRSLGAMGSDRYAHEPALACRPFDQQRDGFIYGEACGAVVVERVNTAMQRHLKPYSKIAGWSMRVDGNRNPDPSLEGEVMVIREALQHANLSAMEIDYINPHGSGSILGDEIELNAILDCQLSHAYLNATKSITGHGISSAGTVEVIATLLQMRESKLHPTVNLVHPIRPSFNWVMDTSISHDISNALCLSMGFGGINTAICLQKI